MTNIEAMNEIKDRYPRLTVRRTPYKEFRLTQKDVSKERAEELAYYTEDRDDLLSSAFCWVYE